MQPTSFCAFWMDLLWLWSDKHQQFFPRGMAFVRFPLLGVLSLHVISKPYRVNYQGNTICSTELIKVLKLKVLVLNILILKTPLVGQFNDIVSKWWQDQTVVLYKTECRNSCNWLSSIMYLIIFSHFLLGSLLRPSSRPARHHGQCRHSRLRHVRCLAQYDQDKRWSNLRRSAEENPRHPNETLWRGSWVWSSGIFSVFSTCYVSHRSRHSCRRWTALAVITTKSCRIYIWTYACTLK